ncbi:MAG: hypothetical protein ACK4Z5_02945 [Brevundimonas sp.]
MVAPAEPDRWTPRRVVADRDLTLLVYCRCRIRQVDPWAVPRVHRDSDLARVGFRCRRCDRRADLVEVVRAQVGVSETVARFAPP